MKRTVSWVSVVLAILMIASGVFAAQQMREIHPPEHRVIPVDAIKAVSFEVRNANGTPIVEGDQITLTFKFENLSGQTLPDIDWKIAESEQTAPRDGSRLNQTGSATLGTSQSNKIASAPATTTAVYGRHTFKAMADYRNVLHEQNTARPSAFDHRRNNYMEVTINVLPGGVAWLNPNQVKQAMQGSSPVIYNDTASHRSSGCTIPFNITMVDQVQVGLNCKRTLGTVSTPFGSAPSVPQGDRIDVELYRGFELQNDWVVESYESPDTNDRDPKHGSRFIVEPQRGSKKPYAKLHLYADAGNEKSDRIKIRIKGPRDKSPYVRQP